MGFEQFLGQFGLSQYEKMAYTALLRIGRSKSQEIATESKVSYGRIYEILEKLKDKGLITLFPTEPKTFEAIDPKLAFKLIIKQKEDHLHELKKQIELLSIPEQQIKQLMQDQTIVLQGKQKQLSMIGEMHERAKKEILLTPGVYELNTPRKTGTLRALTKGIKIKLLVGEITKNNKHFIKEGIKLGQEVRQNKLSGLRLIVADNKEAMISIVNPATKDRISIYTTNKEFANSMSVFFHALWNASKKVKL